MTNDRTGSRNNGQASDDCIMESLMPDEYVSRKKSPKQEREHIRERSYVCKATLRMASQLAAKHAGCFVVKPLGACYA